MSKLFKAGLAGLVLGAAAASPAFAAPIFQSAVDATLSLTSVSIVDGDGEVDISVEGEAYTYGEDSFSIGDAVSNIDANAAPSTSTSLSVEPLTINLNATGEVTGIGEAEAGALADGFVTLENFSDTNTIQLDFVLDYTLTAIASVDDPVEQLAYAYTNFYAEYSGDFNPIAEFYLAADTDTPDTSFSISDVVMFSIFLDPQAFETLSIFTDVFGFASSNVEPAVNEVPIPSMAGLFALAAFLGLRRRCAA